MHILNVLRYITTRSFLAFSFAFLFSIILGKRFILSAKKRNIGQVVREDGPESHYKKQGTPTSGGIFIFTSMSLAIMLCGNFYAWPLIMSYVLMLAFFILGGLDDYLKYCKQNSKGVSVGNKLFWQFLISLGVMFVLIQGEVVDTFLYVPFVKGPIFDLGWFHVIFGSLVIVGSSNAVNLTDGLDGLAIGPVMTCAVSLGIIAYLTGHYDLADYLYIPYFKNVGELVVLCSAIVGAGMGFLWYNSFPAEIFMGDVGSLFLGGTLGIVAVLTKSEILFIIIGGVFVIETLSVILQVGSYKIRKKRVFKMAPIHHHLELKGWGEPKIIVRFWIVSILLAIIAIATLKLR